jgi:hypothetical protein
LVPILTEAYKYKYNEQPNYAKLRFMLEKILMERDQAPNTKMSWFADRKINESIKLPEINDEEMNFEEDDEMTQNRLPNQYKLRPKQNALIFARQPLIPCKHKPNIKKDGS